MAIALGLHLRAFFGNGMGRSMGQYSMARPANVGFVGFSIRPASGLCFLGVTERGAAELRPSSFYDIRRNTGWVSVGLDHDTAEFAVESIRRWWRSMGQQSYPKAARLPITADGGGSNGSRVRLWKLELQKLADHHPEWNAAILRAKAK